MVRQQFSFDVRRSEEAIIRKIVDRAIAELDIPKGEKTDLTMDLTAVHANGCPLRLSDLLSADGFNFAHDIYGIRRHLNRSEPVRELFGNHFLPRFKVRRAA